MGSWNIAQLAKSVPGIIAIFPLFISPFQELLATGPWVIWSGWAPDPHDSWPWSSPRMFPHCFCWRSGGPNQHQYRYPCLVPWYPCKWSLEKRLVLLDVLDLRKGRPLRSTWLVRFYCYSFCFVVSPWSFCSLKHPNTERVNNIYNMFMYTCTYMMQNANVHACWHIHCVRHDMQYMSI